MTDVVVDAAALARLAAPGGAVDLYLARLAAEVATRAADACPHRSGALAASITVARLTGPQGGYSVGSNLPYAAIVERNTPYLVPALLQVIGGGS